MEPDLAAIGPEATAEGGVSDRRAQNNYEGESAGSNRQARAVSLHGDKAL
jgi:hypothetical protein